MRQAQVWASVYGHVWLMMDKPDSNAGTKAQELEQDIRPYVTMFTPENVYDWKYERTPSGRFELVYLKVIEEINHIDDNNKEEYYRVWTKDEVRSYVVSNDDERLDSTMPNPLGAFLLYSYLLIDQTLGVLV